MDFIFNEFSFHDIFSNVHNSRIGMEDLLKVCKQGREFGMSRLAIRPDFYDQSLANEYSVNNWLNDQDVRKVFKDLLLSIVRYPYIQDDHTAIEDRYISSNAFVINGEPSTAE